MCVFFWIKKEHMQTWKIWLLSFPLIYQFALCQMADSNFEKGDVKHTCPAPVGKSFFARTTLYTYTTTRDQDVAGQVYFKSLWQEKKEETHVDSSRSMSAMFLLINIQFLLKSFHSSMEVWLAVEKIIFFQVRETDQQALSATGLFAPSSMELVWFPHRIYFTSAKSKVQG